MTIRGWQSLSTAHLPSRCFLVGISLVVATAACGSGGTKSSDREPEAAAPSTERATTTTVPAPAPSIDVSGSAPQAPSLADAVVEDNGGATQVMSIKYAASDNAWAVVMVDNYPNVGDTQVPELWNYTGPPNSTDRSWQLQAWSESRRHQCNMGVPDEVIDELAFGNHC